MNGVKNMNNIATYTENLPDNLQDLNSFILVGREKLTAVRAEIRAIEKLELAEEVRKQKRDEARMLGEALLDAEVRVGEILRGTRKSENAQRKVCEAVGIDYDKLKNQL